MSQREIYEATQIAKQQQAERQKRKVRDRDQAILELTIAVVGIAIMVCYAVKLLDRAV